MATTEEDFTFPTATTTDSPPRFFDSPPLWRRSSSTSHHKTSKGKEVEDGEIFNLQSFQEMRGGSAKVRNCTSHDEVEDEEEKMDMLWENLNDDQFTRNRGNTEQNSDISSPRRDMISCVKALKLSKSSGHIISGKKTSILVFIKVLKKVFLMHNSQRAIKNPSW